MNRREVLKKLAMSGAIAAGGSLALSSNAVAATSSGPSAEVPGIPTPSAPQLPATQSFSNSSGAVTLAHSPSPDLPAGTTLTYAWRINAYNISQNPADGLILRSNGLVLQARGQPTCTSCAGNPGFASGGSSASVQTYDDHKKGPKNKKFKGGDTFDVRAFITWYVPRASGGNRVVSAEFMFVGEIGRAFPQPTMVTGTFRDSG